MTLDTLAAIRTRAAAANTVYVPAGVRTLIVTDVPALLAEVERLNARYMPSGEAWDNLTSALDTANEQIARLQGELSTADAMRDELTELRRVHNDLLEAILKDVPEAYDDDTPGETIAERWVADLVAKRDLQLKGIADEIHEAVGRMSGTYAHPDVAKQILTDLLATLPRHGNGGAS